MTAAIEVGSRVRRNIDGATQIGTVTKIIGKARVAGGRQARVEWDGAGSSRHSLHELVVVSEVGR